MSMISQNVKAWEEVGLFPFEHLTLRLQFHIDVQTSEVSTTLELRDLVDDQILELFSIGKADVRDLEQLLAETTTIALEVAERYCEPF
uniref:Uncharacterized protein n=1 Tax=uncultured prokaryote TaxID=198431 RepID=A0A0H5Q7J0_9ZZZZ|nr:hypothetical protein [uncultured prokaryote]